MAAPLPVSGFEQLVTQHGGGGALKHLRDANRFRSFKGDASAAERAEFARDTVRLRSRIRRQNRGLLNPRGAFVQYWDMLLILNLFYTTFVTPFEVGLNLPTELNALLVLNTLLCAFFFVDICIQFILPQPVRDANGETIIGNYERRHSALAWRYLTGWFLIDVITTIPFDLLTYMGEINGEVKIFRTMRVLRLLRVIRILRASTIILRWENSFAIKSTSIALGSFFLGAIVLLHWYACMWCMLATIRTSQREWYGRAFQPALLDLMDGNSANHISGCTGCVHGDAAAITDGHVGAYCGRICLSDCELQALANHLEIPRLNVWGQEAWTCRYSSMGYLAIDHQDKPGEVYAAALLVAIMQIVGGVATIVPANWSEYVLFVFTIFLGAVYFASAQGTICGVATNGDPDEVRWSQNLDALNYMMHDTKQPRETRLNVRRFFRNSKRLFKRKSYEGLLQICLADQLQRDVRYQIASEVFQGVWWLSACNRDFLEVLSSRVRRMAYAPQNRIYEPDTLFMLTHGMATRAGVFLAAGSNWGDILIHSKLLRDTTPAKALSYCEIARIAEADLHEVLRDHPEARTTVMQASLRLATRRAITLIAVFIRYHHLAPNSINDRSAADNSVAQHLVVVKQKSHSKMTLTHADSRESFKKRKPESLTAASYIPTPAEALQAIVGISGLKFGPWREIAYVGSERVLIDPTSPESDETITLLRVFRRYDPYDTGCMDGNQLRSALKDMEVDLQTPEAMDLLKSADEDKNGTVEFSEFRKFVRLLRSLLGESTPGAASTAGGHPDTGAQGGGAPAGYATAPLEARMDKLEKMLTASFSSMQEQMRALMSMVREQQHSAPVNTAAGATLAAVNIVQKKRRQRPAPISAPSTTVAPAPIEPEEARRNTPRRGDTDFRAGEEPSTDAPARQRGTPPGNALRPNVRFGGLDA